MSQEIIQNIILETLTEMGIYMDISQESNEDSILLPTDIDLRDYIGDSIMFISFVVELERKLEIAFPDELLFIDTLASLSGFSYLLMEITNNRKDEFNEKRIEEAEA